MGACLSNSLACPASCQVATSPFTYATYCAIQRLWPRRETCKDFPRVFAGSSVERVICKYFEVTVTGELYNEDQSHRVPSDIVTCLDCYKIINDLYRWYAEKDKSPFRFVCETLEEIMSSPGRFRYFSRADWAADWQHAHVPQIGHVIIFRVPSDAPHLRIIEFCLPEAAFHNLSPSTSVRALFLPDRNDQIGACYRPVVRPADLESLPTSRSMLSMPSQHDFNSNCDCISPAASPEDVLGIRFAAHLAEQHQPPPELQKQRSRPCIQLVESDGTRVTQLGVNTSMLLHVTPTSNPPSSVSLDDFDPMNLDMGSPTFLLKPDQEPIVLPSPTHKRQSSNHSLKSLLTPKHGGKSDPLTQPRSPRPHHAVVLPPLPSSAGSHGSNSSNMIAESL
eukprot:TRINITY_DN3931_c0_g1_i1.p1 TRINITY_DN3931_c0_g1~~TRINITY_DN3931_c0_g1_i1.p1  ORF type:complete len:393 (-),score=30.66 TRINITY_DN3931_c0_g1_i1:457-1635(-)